MFHRLNWKSFWYTNLFSIITLTIGILFTAKPDILTSTCKWIGGLLILIGIVLSVSCCIQKKSRESASPAYGIAFIIAGTLMAVIPAVLKFLIPVLFGLWILCSSLSGLYQNFIFRHDVPHWWLGFSLCAISAALSVYILMRPTTVMEQTVKIIGIVFIIHSVLRILSTILGRKGYQHQVSEQNIIDTNMQE